MGLDNIPGIYPCKREGTAVYNDNEQISCDKTIEVGGCPYHNEKSKDPIVSGINGVTGIVGVDCWYRGKYGNHMLEKLGVDLDGLDFYGDEDDGCYKTPESCVHLADLISIRRETLRDDPEELFDDAVYAEWYLRWAARDCNGLACWY